eukprot:5958604-Pyramimonas_sp.AAC.1
MKKIVVAWMYQMRQGAFARTSLFAKEGWAFASSPCPGHLHRYDFELCMRWGSFWGPGLTIGFAILPATRFSLKNSRCGQGGPVSRMASSFSIL